MTTEWAAPPCLPGHKRHRWRWSMRSMMRRRGDVWVCDHCGMKKERAGYTLRYRKTRRMEEVT